MMTHAPAKGLIFDCDGTLADTMPLHWEAWSEIAGQDKVWCLDAATGNTLWSQTYPCGYGGDKRWIGTRSTPTVDGDKVYT